MKFHLTPSSNDQILSFEELPTISCKIEAIMNNRPLVAYDKSYLTRGHFLIGDPSIDESNPTKSNPTLARRYELLRQILKSF